MNKKIIIGIVVAVVLVAIYAIASSPNAQKSFEAGREAGKSQQ